MKFGLIPEFVGRLPVTVSLENLDESALIEILSEPKNALTKQYAKLFKMDDIELEFEKNALEEIAHMAIERQTGARGLRSIIEDVMRDIMYEIPSMSEQILKVIITEDVIKKQGEPILENSDEKKVSPKKKTSKKSSNESA